MTTGLPNILKQSFKMHSLLICSINQTICLQLRRRQCFGTSHPRHHIFSIHLEEKEILFAVSNILNHMWTLNSEFIMRFFTLKGWCCLNVYMIDIFQMFHTFNFCIGPMPTYDVRLPWIMGIMNLPLIFQQQTHLEAGLPGQDISCCTVPFR